jgi:hypothetical protein
MRYFAGGGRVRSSPLYATPCVVRLDIGWKKERFSTAPGMAYRPLPADHPLTALRTLSQRRQ